MTLISEPGFYKLVGRSRKPAAKKFDRWVRHEVLPAIRKTGSFAPPAPASSRLEDRFERLLSLSEKLVEALAITAHQRPAEPAPVLTSRRAPSKTKGEEYLRVKAAVRTITGGKKIKHPRLVAIGRNLGTYCKERGHESLIFQNHRIYPRSVMDAWLDQGGREMILASVEENGDA